MNEGGGHSGLLEGILLSIVMTEYEDNPLINNKFIQKIAKANI